MDDSREQNKALVKEFFECWSTGNFERAKELFDPQAPWWALRGRDTHTAEFRLNRFANTYRDSDESFRFTVQTVTAEEDRVAAVVEGHARFPGREQYNQLYHALFRVAEGRIAQVWLYYDTALSNRVLHGEGGSGPLPSHS